MLENIFIAMLFIGVIFQVLAIKWESYPLAILSVIWFLKLMLDSLDVEKFYVYQPVVNGSTYVNGQIGTHHMSDFGLSAILLVFVMINTILSFVYWQQNQIKNKGKIL